MNTLELSLVIAVGSVLAGFLGALTGLGGGVVIVPMLTLAFGIDSICDRGFAGFGDRYFFGCGRSLR